MPYDAHKNFAVSSIATAPSPAVSGTSLTVQSGDGAKFPTPPFNITVWANSQQPTTANAEIIRVTAIAGDVFTIVRAQENSTARSIIVGDQLAATITAKTLTDLECPRVQTVASASTVTPNADTDDSVKITAQAAALTLANPSGTPAAMQAMVIRIKDNGTARAITYGTQYRAIGVTLPTTTVVSKITYIGMIWNADDTKWDVTGVSQEA